MKKIHKKAERTIRNLQDFQKKIADSNAPFECKVESTEELPYILYYPPMEEKNHELVETVSYITDCDSLSSRFGKSGSKTQEINPGTGTFVCEIRRDVQQGKFYPVRLFIKRRCDWSVVAKKFQEHLQMRNILEGMG